MRTRFALSLFSVVVCACAPGNPGFFIQAHTAPDDSCIYNSGNADIARGIMDTSRSEVRYQIMARVTNQFVDSSTDGTQGSVVRADANGVSLRSAEVEIRDIAGQAIDFGELPNPFSIPVAGFIPSGGSGTAGQSFAAIDAILSSYGASFRGDDGSILVVSIQLSGVTQSGDGVQTLPFEWPIELCNGCLFQCTMDDEGEPIEAPSCNPGQDTISLTCLAP